MATVKSSVASKIAALTARGNELKAADQQFEQALQCIELGINRARSTEVAQRVAEHGIASLAEVEVLFSQRDNVQAKRQIVQQALQMNRRELDAAESEQTRQTTAAAKPEYRKIVGQMKAAIVALMSAQRAEADFCSRLAAAGGSMGCGELHPMGTDLSFEHWLADAETHYGL